MRAANDEKRIATFEEFWDFYVQEHQSPWTRRLHFAGTTAAVGTLVAAAILKKPKLALFALIAGYGPAWIAHFFLEGNRPATFKYPLWSLRADFVMWKKMAFFQMDAEVARVLAKLDAERADRSEDGGVSKSAAAPAGSARGEQEKSAGVRVAAEPSVN